MKAQALANPRMIARPLSLFILALSSRLASAYHGPRCIAVRQIGRPAMPRMDGVSELTRQLEQVRVVTASPVFLGKEQPGRTAKRISGELSQEPSFTRLFTHDTWRQYTGRPPLNRWFSVFMTWRFSTVWQNVAPVCILAALIASMVPMLPSALLPRINPFPLSLQGTAIGLLLVFRTNNSCVPATAYQRFASVRERAALLLAGTFGSQKRGSSGAGPSSCAERLLRA